MTFVKVISVILIAALLVALSFIGWTYVKPILVSKSEYAKNLPTIEKMQRKCDSLQLVIDTLTINNNEMKIRLMLQDKIISSNKNSLDVQKKIQSQLEKLENKISDTPK